MLAAEIALTDSQMPLRLQVRTQLAGKAPNERALLAGRLAGILSQTGLPESELRAAEEVARQLAQDAIELVRRELAEAVASYPFLPRDIALRLAHDIDDVSCPFLEVADVFSEEDWRQLILTVSKMARLSIARRDRITPPMVEALVEVGDLDVAETVVGNRCAPITAVAYSHIEERFSDHVGLFDELSRRDDLSSDVVVQLIVKVSDAARERLASRFDLDDFTSPLAAKAQAGSLLEVIRSTPKYELRAFAESLQRRGELGPMFVVRVLEERLLDFFVAAMAVRAKIPLEIADKLIRFGGETGIGKLSEKAGIPPAFKPDVVKGVDAILMENRPNAEV